MDITLSHDRHVLHGERLMTLIQMLQASDKLSLPGHEFATVEELVLRYGRSFQPQPKPRHIHFEPGGTCFVNAFVLAHRPRLTYCEGFALGRSGALAHHAWACDRKGRVIDNTWLEPGREYFGVPFARQFLYQVCFVRGMLAAIFQHDDGGIGNEDWLKYGLPKEAVRWDIQEPTRIHQTAVA
jgi:hypothetical protein